MWNGRVGPLSPCAGFLLERPDLEFFPLSKGERMLSLAPVAKVRRF